MWARGSWQAVSTAARPQEIRQSGDLDADEDDQGSLMSIGAIKPCFWRGVGANDHARNPLHRKGGDKGEHVLCCVHAPGQILREVLVEHGIPLQEGREERVAGECMLSFCEDELGR